MNNKSYSLPFASSDIDLAKQIGAFVKHHRMQQNITQENLSKDAGISRSTLSLLERGETVTVATLLTVLRALNKLSVLDIFSIEQTISPLALAREEKKRKKRATGKKEDDTTPYYW
jgi:transcriptional regulator with XRE-family HTH domain